MNIRFQTGKISIDIASKKVSASNLVPRPVVVMKDTAGNTVFRARKLRTGEVVLPKIVRETEAGEEAEDEAGFHYVFVDRSGKEVPSKDVHYYKVNEDGSEKEFSLFPRSGSIKVIREVSATALNTFLVESTYELFAPVTKKFEKLRDSVVAELYEEAERYLREDVIGIGLFSWGGLKQYYAVVHPIVDKDRFVWVACFTQTKILYENMMAIPVVAVKERPPPLEALPPIEALV